MIALRYLAGAAIALAVLLAGAAPAGAALAGVTTPSPRPLGTSWAGPTVLLDWGGAPHAVASADKEFLPEWQGVPGDRLQRELTVTNQGPGRGVLTASLLNVRGRAKSDAAPAALEDISHVFWDLGGAGGNVPVGDARRGSVTVGGDRLYPLGSVPLAQGQSVSFTLGWEFPAEAAVGNQAQGDPGTVAFDVRLELRGEDDEEGPSGGSDPTPNPGGGDPTTPGGQPGGDGPATDPAGTAPGGPGADGRSPSAGPDGEVAGASRHPGSVGPAAGGPGSASGTARGHGGAGGGAAGDVAAAGPHGGLVFTGAHVAGVAAAAIGLLVVGGIGVGVARRRRGER